MANRERTGWRDFAYSKWHRELDDRLSFLDIDWIERCDSCKRILAVCELAVDTGRDDKNYWATQRIARALDAADRQGTVKGFVVLYRKDGSNVITGFRVRQVHPAETDLVSLTPAEWAQRLYKLRWCHPIAVAALPPGHLHQWLRDGAGEWVCNACGIAFDAA